MLVRIKTALSILLFQTLKRSRKSKKTRSSRKSWYCPCLLLLL